MKSSKPSKQRKVFYNMPLHHQTSRVSGHLSKELRKELEKRSIALRKGDKVKIVRGSKKGKEGKISRINRERARIYIEKIIRKKSDGTEILVPINPSNIVVLEIERDDDKRFKRGKKISKKSIEKKSEKVEKNTEKKAKKPEAKTEKKTETKKENSGKKKKA